MNDTLVELGNNVDKRWNVVKVCDKSIPRGNGIRKETVHVSIRFTYYRTESVSIISIK